MLRAATAFAIAAMFVTAPAFADDAEPCEQPTLDEVRSAIEDVRLELAVEWQHARALRAELDELQESAAATTSEGQARLAELRDTLDTCRDRIEDLRGERKGLVDVRVTLRSQTSDSPSAFASDDRSGQR
jgi:septal ring factor EnvC (AmiA/AmiB activator)